MRRGYSADDREPLRQGTDDLPLFISEKPLPYAKGSDTSRDAAEAMHLEAAKLRRLVLACYREHGPMTPDEVAGRLKQSVLAIRPRVTELRQSGFLELTGQRRRNASGLFAKVLRAKEQR